MFHNNALAVLFALGSALTIAWGTVVRHRIARAAGENRSNAIMDAVKVPLWWVGVFSALFGYFLQIIALSFGTLLIVQPILVLSLMFTLPLSAKYDGLRISKSETAWAGLLTVAVAVLVILGKPKPGKTEPDLDIWLWCISIGVGIMLLIYALAVRQAPWARALLLGSITGAIMGYLAVLSKAVVNIFGAFGLVALLQSWEIYGLIIAAALGTAVQQASFNAGPLKNSLPAMTVVEPIVAFILGYIVLGEKFQADGEQWIYLGLAIATMVGSTIILSRKSVKA
ncbi:hypothetical protein F7230_07640 [Corynebacterium sp. 320]|uniref:DMT family transporter n=1 Tax=Corynebacterium TaxID=1716 RepID=UPI00125CB215|nr:MULTISPECIES: DMT family transporter [Corynebacterium]KAB1502858.1 hypothetical protein F7230_07640 [Corynebacterium sp. 320]KAB1552369.1 hypothetical protein F7233_00960 [Corynebacterium sp. 321]KAB1554416.1 hypothetical protein F7232_05635 [Corynebacterium sp. 319]KAB3526521.1 hypothetical protein F8354_07640 [Corynebacterium sp. 250]KAB3539841.1 hypothetical protein F8390_00695 [Corynebacterium sp. 366]